MGGKQTKEAFCGKGITARLACADLFSKLAFHNIRFKILSNVELATIRYEQFENTFYKLNHPTVRKKVSENVFRNSLSVTVARKTYSIQTYELNMDEQYFYMTKSIIDDRNVVGYGTTSAMSVYNMFFSMCFDMTGDIVEQRTYIRNVIGAFKDVEAPIGKNGGIPLRIKDEKDVQRYYMVIFSERRWEQLHESEPCYYTAKIIEMDDIIRKLLHCR